MPEQSIHPDHAGRIERECAAARQQARGEQAEDARASVKYWTECAPANSTAMSTMAYCEEKVRLHGVILAALEADQAGAPRGEWKS